MDEDAQRPIAIDPAALDPRQRQVHDAILSGPRGIVEGPLSVWLLSPDFADRAQILGTYCRYGTSLPPHLSELAILVTGAHWRAGFEWHVHAPIAAAAGITDETIEAIRLGSEPSLTGAEGAVYDFCRALLRARAVDDAVYAAAVGALGRQGVVELVGILGYYGLISMTINAFCVPMPDGAASPFA